MKKQEIQMINLCKLHSNAFAASNSNSIKLKTIENCSTSEDN